MNINPDFLKQMQEKYAVKGKSITLGAPLYENHCYSESPILLPLSMLNRHGLIAGATGTGKTKTLQVFAECLSEAGVPVMLMDLKGDLSGLGAPGQINSLIEQRYKDLQLTYSPKAYPIEFLSLTEKDKIGIPLRATVSEFGPILLSRILELNDTQSSILSMIFKYCDNERLSLLDLKDLKQVILHLNKNTPEGFESQYGNVSSQSTSVMMRKIIELEQQGAETFFGEPSFEVEDLCRLNQDGFGFISMLQLSNLQDKPNLFSTFMLCLLAEIYATFEEIGDIEKPKLLLIIDEAHLLFQYASKALMDQLETIIKLIRSKGVGIYFCTQSPKDIPDSILGQLGLKIQHALRAFTAKDRKEIKLIAENFPESSFYDIQNLLTSMGVGEALVTSLNEKGIPTPLVHVLLKSPNSRMGSMTESEKMSSPSTLMKKYQTSLDRESAFEILQTKLAEKPSEPAHQAKATTSKSKSTPVSLTETMAKQAGRMIVRELTRSLLGVLGIKRRR